MLACWRLLLLRLLSKLRHNVGRLQFHVGTDSKFALDSTLDDKLLGFRVEHSILHAPLNLHVLPWLRTVSWYFVVVVFVFVLASCSCWVVPDKQRYIMLYYLFQVLRGIGCLGARGAAEKLKLVVCWRPLLMLMLCLFTLFVYIMYPVSAQQPQ